MVKPHPNLSEQTRADGSGAPRLFTTSGFTYVGVIILLVVLSISLGMAGRYWSTVVKREKEEELLFRGAQFVKAVEAYYNQDNRSAFPTSMEDLLKDKRSLVPRRFLRRVYADPMTGKPNWTLLKNSGGGIIGVASQSGGVPLKKGGFPSDYREFEGKQSYSQWRFIFDPKKKEQQATSKPK